jgi:hypothetical protein
MKISMSITSNIDERVDVRVTSVGNRDLKTLPSETGPDGDTNHRIVGDHENTRRNDPSSGKGKEP